MEQNDQKFITGFNSGYLLEQYEPEMLAQVLKELNLSNDYIIGLSEGQKELQHERILGEMENLNIIRNSGKNPSDSLNR